VAGFIWNEWNVAHVAKHGVTRRQAEYVVKHPRRPFPSYEGDDKWLVQGQDEDGNYLQVIYVLESDARGIDYADLDLIDVSGDPDSVFVVHARPLEDDEKRRLRRRRKGGPGAKGNRP